MKIGVGGSDDIGSRIIFSQAPGSQLSVLGKIHFVLVGRTDTRGIQVPVLPPVPGLSTKSA